MPSKSYANRYDYKKKPTPIGTRTPVGVHAPERFDAKEVLRRTGMRARHESRAAGGDFQAIGNGLTKLGAGDFTGTAGNVVLVVLGGIFGLILLNLLLSTQGSRIASTALTWTGSAFRRLVSPTDPLTGTAAGATVAPAPPPAGTPKAPQPGGGTQGEPWQSYGGVLYPTPSGTQAPVAGSSAELDSSYTSFAQWIEKNFGVTITSGYRTSSDNAAVGGAPNSDHLKGLAADFAGTPAAMQRLYAWALSFGFPYVESPAQAQAAGEGPHVHISFFRPSTSTTK